MLILALDKSSQEPDNRLTSPLRPSSCDVGITDRLTCRATPVPGRVGSQTLALSWRAVRREPRRFTFLYARAASSTCCSAGREQLSAEEARIGQSMSVDFVAAGYQLCVRWEPPERQQRGGLPSKVLTASSCLAVSGPGPWGFAWVKDDATTGFHRNGFGISLDHLADLGTWLDDRMKAGSFGWPNLFLDLTTAQAFLEQFRPTSSPRIIGLGLPTGELDLVFADHPDTVGVGREGFVVGLERGLPLADNGVRRGYEILGEEHGARSTPGTATTLRRLSVPSSA